MSWKQWTREPLTAAQLQEYLQDQTVMSFTSASQRDSLLPSASRKAGMLTHLEDVRRYERWSTSSGGSWKYLGGDGPPITTCSLTGFAAVAGRTPGYAIDGDGYVAMEGAMTNSGVFTPGPAQRAITGLPVPSKLSNYIVGSSIAGGFANLEIRNTSGVGELFVVFPTTSAAAGTTFALDGIRYRP